MAVDLVAPEMQRGRSADAVQGALPMSGLLAQGTTGAELPLRFAKDGKGTLHYGARLTYAPTLPSDGTTGVSPWSSSARI